MGGSAGGGLAGGTSAQPADPAGGGGGLAVAPSAGGAAARARAPVPRDAMVRFGGFHKRLRPSRVASGDAALRARVAEAKVLYDSVPKPTVEALEVRRPRLGASDAPSFRATHPPTPSHPPVRPP